MEELKDKILAKTNNGKEILLKLYPQAVGPNGKLQHFKLRADERTPSATLFEGGRSGEPIWFVKDFGSGYAANCFQAYMDENNIDNFAVCLRSLAEEWNIDCFINNKNNQSNVEIRVAENGRKEKEAWTVLKDEPSQDDLKALGPFVTKDVLKTYNYYAVKEKHYIYKDKDSGILKEVITTSTPSYPIFTHKMHWKDENGKEYNWEKIYCPKEPNKGLRFSSAGDKAPKYINGYDVAKREKAEVILICAGERDSLNAAGMGYYPVWFNSETEVIDSYYMNDLRKTDAKIIYVGDIDKTGLEATRQNALTYPEMYSIVLPKKMQELSDARGNKSKDLLDFIYYNQKINKEGKIIYSKYEFDQLVRTCRRCQFWDYEEDNKGKQKIVLSTLNLLYFLEMSGYYKYRIPNSHNTMFIKIDGYKVKEIEPKQIRGYIKNYLLDRHESKEVVETFLNSKKTTVSLYDDLDEKELDFTFCDHESRIFFFENKAIRVTKDGIEEVNIKDLNTYCWDIKVIKHKINLQKERQLDWLKEQNQMAFPCPEDKCSKLLQYLINASRIYWREELEERITGDTEQDKQYAEQNHYTYWGSRITDEEFLRQEEFFKNKIYCIGRLLHRYKFYNKAQCIWIMETSVSAEKASNGRSGKSFIMKAIEVLNLLNIAYLEGRNKKLTDNQHYMDVVTPATDVLQIDDIDFDFSFNEFYSKVSGSMTINPKNQASYTIPYKESPNIVFTSNFAPKNLEQSSTMARILPMVYSDYYHQIAEDNIFNYKENRSIGDDFGGIELLGHEYTDEDRNRDYILFLNIMQIYLQWLDENKYQGMPPMEEVLKRSRKGKMGTPFEEWATDYFSKEGDKLNVKISKIDAYCDYEKSITSKKELKSATAWKSALKAFCKVNGYIFNPEDIKGYQSDGRIIDREVIDGINKTVEKIFIRWNDPDKPVTPQEPEVTEQELF